MEPKKWQLEQTTKYLGKFVLYNNSLYEVIDTIKCEGEVTLSNFNKIAKAKISEISIKEIVLE
jgi:hypothetical protein